MLDLLPNLKNRDLVPELMDDPALESGLHARALRGLERINRFSFLTRTFWNPLKRFYNDSGKKPVRILDIASGGGDLLRRFASKAQKENLPFIFEGCDINPEAVRHSQKKADDRKLSVSYFVLDALREPIPERFDVIFNSLFLHHLKKNEVIAFLKTLKASRAKLALICDLKRSLKGWLLAYAGTRLLTTSPIVHFDGPQSVRAAFTSEEMLGFAEEAGLTGATIQSIWPDRYLLLWSRP